MTVTITTSRGDLPAYLATPPGSGPWPGIEEGRFAVFADPVGAVFAVFESQVG